MRSELTLKCSLIIMFSQTWDAPLSDRRSGPLIELMPTAFSNAPLTIFFTKVVSREFLSDPYHVDIPRFK